MKFRRWGSLGPMWETDWLPTEYDCCEHLRTRLRVDVFSFLLDKYTGMELLGHMDTVRNCQNIFFSSCIILHSHQPCMRVLVALQTWQHRILWVFYIAASLVDMKCYILGILICIFLMINDTEHLFVWLSAVCMHLLLWSICSNLVCFLFNYLLITELQELFI